MSGPALMSGRMRYILVVDSGWNERFTLSLLLQRFGYAVASSSSAAEGIEFLCVAPPVAVFAEAGAAGDELVRRLAADIRFRDTPLIMVTDRPDRRLDERLQRGEIAGLLRTPLSPDEVFRVIQAVIEKGRRENIRIATALRAVLNDEQGTTEGFVTVLSQYGMFFRTMEPRPVNASVPVVVSFGDRSVEIQNRVLYVVSFESGPFCEPGMGMKFTGIGAEGSALIRFFIHDRLGAGFRPPGPFQSAGTA